MDAVARAGRRGNGQGKDNVQRNILKSERSAGFRNGNCKMFIPCEFSWSNLKIVTCSTVFFLNLTLYCVTCPGF